MGNTKSKLVNASIEGMIEALKDENECLRMEVDYLKKLKDFVQKRWNYRTRQSKSNLSYKIRRYGTY